MNATYGLGVLVPFGMAAPDVVRVERTTGQVIEYVVGEKRRAFYVASGGLEERDVATDDIHGRSLSDPSLARLSEYATRLEQAEPKTPLELEFAVHSDRVWFLKARPILGNTYPEGGETDTVWSRASSGETLPGVATPLTWSLAAPLCERGLRKAFRDRGTLGPARNQAGCQRAWALVPQSHFVRALGRAGPRLGPSDHPRAMRRL